MDISKMERLTNDISFDVESKFFSFEPVLSSDAYHPNIFLMPNYTNSPYFSVENFNSFQTN